MVVYSILELYYNYINKSFRTDLSNLPRKGLPEQVLSKRWRTTHYKIDRGQIKLKLSSTNHAVLLGVLVITGSRSLVNN